jgi:hypothetical protein
MRTYQLFCLGLLVILTGLFAGQMFHEMIGAQEVLQPLDNHTYITYWQSLDKLMHVRMPIMCNLILLVFLVNLIILRQYRNNWFYWAMLISFLCLVAETLVTVILQLPVNARVQGMDPLNLPTEVASLKAATLIHFVIRAILRFIGFILLIIATFKLLVFKISANKSTPRF